MSEQMAAFSGNRPFDAIIILVQSSVLVANFLRKIGGLNMKNSPSRSFNYGFAVLKILMSFEVVLWHCWDQMDGNIVRAPIRSISLIAVPVFALISFYLTADSFMSATYQIVRKRMLRLCWPQAAWTVIYWLIYRSAGIVHGCDEFLWQMFTGHSAAINTTMWYQVVIIAISVLFFGIGFLIKGKKMIIATTAVGLAALIFQYGGLNHILFAGLRIELRYPIGRFAEMLPYASLGLLFADKNILERLKKHPCYVAIFACVMLIVSFSGIIPTPPGFNYTGLNPILCALAIVMIVNLIPFDKACAGVKNFIHRVSR